MQSISRGQKHRVGLKGRGVPGRQFFFYLVPDLVMRSQLNPVSSVVVVFVRGRGCGSGPFQQLSALPCSVLLPFAPLTFPVPVSDGVVHAEG